MEKFKIVRVLICMMIASVLCVHVCADDLEYDGYLKKAWSYLGEGNIEAAETQYEIYKGITGKSVSNFEAQINSMKSKDWKSQCHIISVGNGKKIAVQKEELRGIRGKQLKYAVKSSPLGDFTDWRLPTTQEMFIIIETLKIVKYRYYFVEDTKRRCFRFYDYPVVDVANKKRICVYGEQSHYCFLVRDLE